MPNRPVAATVQPGRRACAFGGRLGNVRVEYFADRELKESRLSRLDESIDRYWPDGITPSPEVPTLFAADGWPVCTWRLGAAPTPTAPW